MEKEEFYYLSGDKKTNIRAVYYIPDVPRAVLQISHGMCEFIDRYDNFAQYLCNKGIVVCGNDHLGHGKSITSKDKYGYFCEKDGDSVLIEDMHYLVQITKEKYPDIPYFMLGHSMGSFLCNDYLIDHGQELAGAIIMGTGQVPVLLLKSSCLLCKIMALFKGWHYRSQLLNSLSIGSYNKTFEPSNTHKDWLCKDPDIIDKYIHEERCTYVFTLNAFYYLFKLMIRIQNKKNLTKMPKDLPVLFVSGENDPVGDFTKSVKKVIKLFKDSGMKNVDYKFYKDDRHEILNELDKELVYEDLLNYIGSICDVK